MLFFGVPAFHSTIVRRYKYICRQRKIAVAFEAKKCDSCFSNLAFLPRELGPLFKSIFTKEILTGFLFSLLRFSIVHFAFILLILIKHFSFIEWREIVSFDYFFCEHVVFKKLVRFYCKSTQSLNISCCLFSCSISKTYRYIINDMQLISFY